MGYGTKLLIMLFCLSFCMFLVNSDTYYTKFDTFVSTLSFNTIVSYFLNSTLVTTLFGMIGIITVGALIVGAYTGNYGLLESLMPYLISASVILSINLFFIVPISDFSTEGSVMLPNPLSTFIVIIFNIMLFGLAISFISGRDF